MIRDAFPAPPCLNRLNIKQYLLALKLSAYQVSSRCLLSTWADLLSSQSEICHSLGHTQLLSMSSHWAHLVWHLDESKLLCRHSQFPRPSEGSDLVKETAWNAGGYQLQNGAVVENTAQKPAGHSVFLLCSYLMLILRGSTKFCTIQRELCAPEHAIQETCCLFIFWWRIQPCIPSLQFKHTDILLSCPYWHCWQSSPCANAAYTKESVNILGTADSPGYLSLQLPSSFLQPFQSSLFHKDYVSSLLF